MRAKTFPIITFLAVLALLLSGPATVPEKANAIVSPQPAAAPQARITEALRSSPVMFIQNVGQFDERALFQVRGADRTIWLTEDAIWVTVLEKPSPSKPKETGFKGEALVEEEPRKGVNIKLSFPGSNPRPSIEPFDRLDTVVSYFIGNDPAKWRTNVPVWGGVRYKDLYPGIDLEITSEGGHLVQRLVARPGADLSVVRLRIEGADSIALAGGEGLRLTTAVGDFTLPLLTVAGGEGWKEPSIAVQAIAEQTFEVSAPFASLNLNLQSSIQNQQSSDLLYSTFLGGGGGDSGWDIAVDSSGAAYVTGGTNSSDFPTTSGAFDPTYNGGRDAFVVKLNPSGSALAYATFLGGGGGDSGWDIAVDSSGAAYVTGGTESSDFPTTSGAYDRTYNGYGDAFVVKLSSSGSALSYSTFLGGGAWDFGRGIAVDSSGAAYVTGWTESSDFPTTSGAFDRTLSGDYDAFVVKLNPSGTALAYATFLGGSDWDLGWGIAVDTSGAAYVTGETGSSDFPTTPGAFDRNLSGDCDAFVVKLNPSGSALAYSTFLGGGSWDEGFGIALDSSGAAYVMGLTYSSDFPTTSGAFDRTLSGDYDAFVVKLSSSGSALAYATFLGGSDEDQGNGIALDSSGAAYVTGWTESSDFPTTSGAFDRTLSGDYDAFVVKLNPSGTALAYSTFLGGSYGDEGYGIAVDTSGAAYVTGGTESSDFPTTPGAFDSTYNGNSDAFVVKLVIEAAPGGPPNDNRANATILGVPSTWTQSTTGATTEAGEPAMCASWGATVWFRFTAPSSGMITVDTFESDYDTVLAAYPMGSNTQLACNDDTGGLQSQISFQVSAGSVYEIQVGGYDGSTGNLRLNVSSVSGPPNDNRANATIVGVPSTWTQSTTGATTEAGEPAMCASWGATVWFRFTAPSSGMITVDTFESDYDTVLAAYPMGSNTQLACNDDTGGLQSQISFQVSAGSVYEIQVGGYDGSTGNLRLNVSSVSGPTPTPTPSAQKPWTFMLYLDGDNDLYPYLNRAIAQLEAQPANPNVNILVLFDGDRTNDSWRFLVQPGGNYTIGVNKWYMGELNMGDPQTLANFIIWARENYSAQHYYLAIANHGRGTTGVAWDDTNNRDYLSTSELRIALQTATNSGQWKIDVLHYDACLMALLENAYQVKDYADYLVASQNLGWGVFAYDAYTRVQGQGARGISAPYEFATLVAKVTASTTPRQLAIDVADAYFNHPAISGYPRTISALDLSKAVEVRQAVDAFATALRNNLSTIKTYLQNSRSATQKFDSRDYFRITDDDEYLDLYHFAQRVRQYVPNSDVESAAQGVMNALNSGFVVVEHHQSGMWREVYWDLDNAHGVSIYFPPRSGSSDYNRYISHQLFRFTSESVWDEFLVDYFGAMGLPPESPIEPGLPPMLAPEYKVYLPLVLRNR